MPLFVFMEEKTMEREEAGGGAGLVVADLG